MNPIEQTKYLEEKYRKYIKSTFQLNNPIYQDRFENELNLAKLVKGPYVIPTLPFESSKSLEILIQEKKISKLWKDLKEIDLTRKLYVHQEKAFEKIKDGKSVVITTGTGSGKTESFLYPILNSILEDIENGKDKDGIRAIFLYPMNALVNDQIDRLRSILAEYPEITYGYYIGDTPLNEDEGLRKELGESNGCIIPQNELVSRKEIRENPPNLLFTNYSMLEYLLIRPQDSFLFNKDTTRNWKYIVLDEAHTYAGALGIELSYLLKRVTGLTDNKIQFILTSATLGKGEEDVEEIINFAHSLTGADFSSNDIIFGKRENIENTAKREYALSAEDIEFAFQNKNDLPKLKKKFEKYIVDDNINEPELFLYELLKKDKNMYDLYNVLKNDVIKEYKDVLEEFKVFDELHLSYYIKLLNVAKKNNKPLYDNKYHTFVKSLSGAYITIGNEKELKLNNCLKINDKNAFEIGVCKHCNQMFIIGKNQNGYLKQNQFIDIDENYDEFDDTSVEYFILKEEYNAIDEDLEELEEYEVCSKCGKINCKKAINKEYCKCGQEHIVDVYKVLTNDSKMKNNLSKCPCCKNYSTIGGVVIGFNIGKDRATALISQILYETLEGESEIEKDEDYSFFDIDSIEDVSLKEEKEQNKVKQFLAFSDSRQQASYYATFFNYNYKNLMRKRIIWEVLQNNDNYCINLVALVNSLRELIEEKKLFTGEEYTPEEQAWLSVLYELLLVDGNNSAEGLGLFYFKLNRKNFDLFVQNAQKDMELFRKTYNVTDEEIYDVLCVVLEMFRTNGAIEDNRIPLGNEIIKEELGNRRVLNYIAKKKDILGKYSNIKSFIPVKEYMTNKAMDYVQKCFNLDRKKSVELLERLFAIAKYTYLQDKTIEGETTYRINPSEYILHSYLRNDFYKCNVCNKISAYNVRNICPTKGCSGKLIKCDVDKDKVLANNFYRNEYKTKKIEKMIIKEHTAQLDKKAAKKYQREFKDKKINILSCSTTFEMGVDIGSLENVFLRNVPPSPANYVQRAGRAGRGKDSSAFILTFCSTSSHDYNYFCDPSKMILGIVEPPCFKINNEKIIIRHLTAASLGYFFREKNNSEYYKNIESFIENGGIEKFKTYLESKPLKLQEYLDEKILHEDILEEYREYKWINKIFIQDSDLLKFREYIKTTISSYEDARKKSLRNNDGKMSDYYRDEIEKIKKGRVIDNLTRYSVIPKYGFPVDVIRLDIFEKNGKQNNKYELARDLSIALSEYAPESEVLVDDNKYTSRYLNYKKNMPLTKNLYFECTNCKKVNIDIIQSAYNKCKYCGQVYEKEIKYYVQPIGFSSDRNNVESKNVKPKKTYSSDIKYIGNGERIEETKIIKDVVFIEPLKDDELIILNENPFFRCLTCGYSKIDRNALNSIVLEHNDKFGYKCGDKNLERYSLGYKFKTDVIKIKIKNRLIDYYKALSTLFAILEGISLAFNIDRNDINGLVTKNEENDDEYSIIVFDSVPGGAGYVKNLLNEEKIIIAFEKALERVSQECCDENTSCYNCLRNYRNQKFHKSLKRIYAKETLTETIKMLKE